MCARRANAKAPRADTTWPLIRRIAVHYLWPHKTDLGWAMAAMLVLAAGLAMQAHLIQPLFDRGLIDKHIGVVNTVIVTLVVLTVARGIASFYQDYFMESAGQRVVARLQEEMYAQTLGQDLGFFARHPTGSLTSRFISDLQRLKYAVTQTFASGLRDVGTILGLFANMLVQDWQLTLYTLIVIPLATLPIRRFGRLTRKYSRVNQESTAKLAHLLAQTLGHIRQVQSYAMEAAERARVNARIQDVLATTLKTISVRALSSPTVEFITIVAIASLMWYAGNRIADGTLTPGAFASFIASLIMILRPLKAITNLNNNLQEGLAAAQRAFELIDAPHTLKNARGAQPLKAKQGALAFEDVHLTYPDGTRSLNGIDLSIPAGHTVAFVGPSGAGKTSLLNVIPRFYDLSAGRITIDKQDIAAVTLASLRQNIALVTQDVAIFDDTVAANIAYGSPKASQKKVEAAARAAAAHEFISQLPEGYQTMLGENGMKLSGGQKQRLALARALLKDAPVLLLDEATSALDTESEKQVQQAIEATSKGRTTVIVAHRLSTITHADTIYVLQNGRIAEEGSHRSLLAKKGLYARLWRLQGAE
ncbi:MAG: ABC transporter ATP-binding protein [Pseudomonadaceae bacterium]|nr:ABC transporter ATP-binding protein [Pseudomonadaceae bacterium]